MKDKKKGAALDRIQTHNFLVKEHSIHHLLQLSDRMLTSSFIHTLGTTGPEVTTASSSSTSGCPTLSSQLKSEPMSVELEPQNSNILKSKS